MAEAVVDDLEVVEVDEEDCHGGVLSLGTLERELEPVDQEGTIGKIRQWIVKGEACQLLLEGLTLSDVVEGDDQPTHTGVEEQVIGDHLEVTPAAVGVLEAQLRGDIHTGLSVCLSE